MTVIALLVALVMLLALCRAAAPRNPDEWERDDRAQAEYLRQWKEQRA
jgi:hypothetical protein